MKMSKQLLARAIDCLQFTQFANSAICQINFQMRPLLVSIRTIAQQNPQQKTLLARILSHKMSSDSKYPGLTSGPFNWINNKRVESSLPETFEDVEPRTGKVLAKVPVSGQAELDQAVHAAKAAFTYR